MTILSIILWCVMLMNVLCVLSAFCKMFTAKLTHERVAYFVGLIFHIGILYLLISAYF